MKRREMLKITGAALGLSLFPAGWTALAQQKKHKVLYFTQSAGFEHSAVKRNGDQLSFSEKTLIDIGKRNGIEVVCTKDGTVFDGDLDQYDAIAFYTSGDLTEGKDKYGNPPMSVAGKKKLLDTIAAGKGFVGFHSATDSFRNPGSPKKDPYIVMVGGEFIGHGTQQNANQRITSPKFPGLAGLGDSFGFQEEWYTFDKYGDDLHVILVQDTTKMSTKADVDKKLYDRPPFPATWARMHGKGRVFYTSMGHREDVWTNPIFQQIVLGGFAWAMHDADADVTPNIAKVTPKANQLHNT